MAIEVLALMVTFLFCLYVQTKFKVKSSSKLYWKKNKRNMAILSLCPKLNSGYQPTFWARNSHIQTIIGCAGHFLSHRFQFETEYIQMSDGGMISLQWYTIIESSSNDKNQPISEPILIISTWVMGPDVISACEAAAKEGYQPVIYNSRGHNVPLTTRQLATFLDASDFKEAVDYIHHTYPFCDLFTLGYSLGALPVIGYLGTQGKSSLITAAVFVSTALDLESVLNSGFKRPYKKIVNDHFRKIIRENTCLHSVMDESNIYWNGSLHNILKEAYLATNPYDSFSGFIKANNPASYVRNIRTPALFINALDDPVINETVPAYTLLRSNPYCLEVITDTGGHCGFLEGLAAASWTDGISLEFYSAVMQCRSLILTPVKNGFTRLRSVTR